MEKLLSVILCGTIVCFGGGAFSSSDINRTDAFDLIDFCEANEVHSEEELQSVLDTYYCYTEDAYSNENQNSDEVVSFELMIDYENEYVITTTVYRTNNTRSTASGYAVQNYRSSAGFIIFTVQVDGDYYYNGSNCYTTSATATFTPSLMSGWSSSPSAGSGKKGSKAYAKAYGTAVNGNSSYDYELYLYCDVNGNLSTNA